MRHGGAPVLTEQVLTKQVLTKLVLTVLALVAASVQPATGAPTARAGQRVEGHGVSVGMFSPGTPAEDEGWRDPMAALDVGDCIIDQPGGSPPAGCMVSLGRGGSLELVLDIPATADGSSSSDLWVGECCEQWELNGPFDRLRVEGFTSGGELTFSVEGTGRQAIDLDAFGFRPWEHFVRVRITDITTEDVPDDNAGPDIDSVTGFAAINAVSADHLLGGWRSLDTGERLSFSGQSIGRLGGRSPEGQACREFIFLDAVERDNVLEVRGSDCLATDVDGFGLLEDAQTLRLCVRPQGSAISQPYGCTDWFAEPDAPVVLGGADSDIMIGLLVLWVIHVILGIEDEPVPTFAQSGTQTSTRQAPTGPLVYLATEDAFPDALAVAGITGLTEGFTVLVDPDDPTGNAALLDAVDPSEIVIVGGTAAIPDSAIPDDGTPRRRLGGASRFDTAALLSREHHSPGVDIAYIATGNNYPDALAGGAIASNERAPILLVDGERVPDETATELRRLSPGRIVVLGGTAVIADTVVDALRGFTDGTVSRIAGPDRTATAVAASQAAFPNGADIVMIANAEDFRSAEGAAGLAWATGGPLLLVRPDGQVPAVVRNEIVRLNPDRLLVAAAEGELSAAVLDELHELR